MTTFDDVTRKNKTTHNPNWPQISDHPYRMLITRGSKSENNVLYINKIYLHVKVNYQFLINNCENVDLKYYNDP